VTLAEYADPAALIAAIRRLREAGAQKLEAYTPYPVHGLDEALGQRRSPLAIAAGVGGLLGAVGGYFLQWYLVAYLYPVDLGDRPPHMPLAFVIITIEMGFLFGGLTVFFACLFAARLFKLWDPVFDAEGFESATRAGYWLAIADTDPAFEDVLRRTEPRRISGVGGRP
jgi:hypothetical protein